jgi:AbrB family looped-hinge helix DNA binding protein
MKEYRIIVGHNGQVTVPGEIRRLLSLKQGDAAMFVVRDGRVELVRVDNPDDRMQTADDLRNASREKIIRQGFEPQQPMG